MIYCVHRLPNSCALNLVSRYMVIRLFEQQKRGRLQWELDELTLKKQQQKNGLFFAFVVSFQKHILLLLASLVNRIEMKSLRSKWPDFWAQKTATFRTALNGRSGCRQGVWGHCPGQWPFWATFTSEPRSAITANGLRTCQLVKFAHN